MFYAANYIENYLIIELTILHMFSGDDPPCKIEDHNNHTHDFLVYPAMKVHLFKTYFFFLYIFSSLN